MIPFAELSLKAVIDYYSNTAHFAEIIQATVITDIIEVYI